MALGKPVIATDGGGTKEIVDDGVTGFLIDKSDPVQLAYRIEMLLKDPEMRIAMGEKGRARVSELFSIESMTGKYVDLYLNR
jgi:glycosyltransferase involved in cell wall biosynthesis